jgi:hypothetical protein
MGSHAACVILLDDIFSHLIEFMDTMSYGNMLCVSNELHRKCEKYKKTRYPFIVIEDVYQYGDSMLSETCQDEFYNLQFSKFDTMEEISKNMAPHLHQLLFQIVAKIGLDAARCGDFSLRFYSVPWRFRKCVDYEEYNDRYYMKIDTDLYITSCLKKCKKIMKDSPVIENGVPDFRHKEVVSTILLQKILRKYKKSKHAFSYEWQNFDHILNKKFATRK